MNDAAQFVEIIEKRTGFKVGCIEEVAFQERSINANQLAELVKLLQKSGYGRCLERILERGP